MVRDRHLRRNPAKVVAYRNYLQGLARSVSGSRLDAKQLRFSGGAQHGDWVAGEISPVSDGHVVHGISFHLELPRTYASAVVVPNTFR